MKAYSSDDHTNSNPSETPATAVPSVSAVGNLNEEQLLIDFKPALSDWANRYSDEDPHLRKDLFQEGALGLILAARRFKPAMGVKFATFARRYMTGRMFNYLRQESPHYKCLALAEACYVPAPEDSNDDNLPAEDCLPITASAALEKTDMFLFEVDVRLLRFVMDNFMELLTEKQQKIFKMRYVEGLQPSEIAHSLGVSPARITQVLTEAIAKIHSSFEKS